MYMHACVHFVFGLGFLVPGRPPDIYANIPNSEANQESETLLSQHFGKKDAQFVYAQKMSLL